MIPAFRQQFKAENQKMTGGRLSSCRNAQPMVPDRIMAGNGVWKEENGKE